MTTAEDDVLFNLAVAGGSEAVEEGQALSFSRGQQEAALMLTAQNNVMPQRRERTGNLARL